MTKENIHVIIRFRPKNKREKKEEREQKVKDKPIAFQNNDGQRIGALEIEGTKSRTAINFTFDRILDSNVSQANTFYHVAEHVCADILDGYNGCIFAYGQTGSGKTYTMFGPEDDHAHPQKMGIIPRSISYIFTEIEEDPDIMEARIKVSFVEIYKEKLRDLLNPGSKKKLSIRLQPNGETRIANVTETHVLTLLDVLQLMEVANSYRTKAETSMNHSSSRSHMLMTLTVALRMEDGSISVGKLNFCDLAGSEKVRKTGATGNRLKEAQKINLSLTILGQVIAALAKSKKHVPFRDSKLTHVLKDSLGGNCKTTLIVNCTKSMFNRDETINSLRFGSRCKLITNNVKANRVYSNAELMSMIEKLRRQNTQLSGIIRNKGYSSEDLLVSPQSNKLFQRKKSGQNFAQQQEIDKLTAEAAKLQGSMHRLEDKNHYLQLQNDKLADKLHTISDQMSHKERQTATLSARLSEYQSRMQTLTKDINFIENESQRLKLKNKSLQRQNDEYKMEIKDISKDRHYKTSKLNNQLSKFKELHTDAMHETTELMEEVLKLKQGLEKSEAVSEAQDRQLIQKRAYIDNVEQQLLEAQIRAKNISKEKKALQTQVTDTKQELSESKASLNQKDEEIEKLKDELAERTQILSTQNYELTQRIEQREMIQHAYSLRSNPESIQSPNMKKKNTAMMNAGVSSTYNPKIMPALSTKASFQYLLANDDTPQTDVESALLLHSASIHCAEDVINAEQSLLAQHEYLKKMETERLVERHSTGTYKTRRQSKLGTKQIKSPKVMTLSDEKKMIETEIEESQTKLEALTDAKMPEDKEQRLNVLVEIATVKEHNTKLKRKLKNIAKKMKKSKKSKSPKNTEKETGDMISKVTTVDALNYVDAALTLSSLRNDDEEDHVFNV